MSVDEQIPPAWAGAAATGASADPGFLTRPRLTRGERRTRGKAVRAAVRRESHAEVPAPSERPDARAVLDRQDADREPGLVPLRHERMATDPFAFLRGSAAVMAADLAGLPRTPLAVQLCGDAHAANFGMFASPDRRLVFDLNDFDETLSGPFEWDVKRLAASIAVIGRVNGISDRKTRRAVTATVAGYRTTMRTLSVTPTLDAWYARVDVDPLMARVRDLGLRTAARRARAKAGRSTGDSAAAKLTTISAAGRRFRSRPPLLVPVEEAEHPGVTARLTTLFGGYLRSLPEDRAVLLTRYRLVDLAHKVVGVGSVGTRALVVLLESGDGEPLILQVKQAGRSVLEPYLHESRISHAGLRVVIGQRLLQATGDPFLGWTTGTLPALPYYVRQLRDMKGSIEPADLDGDALAAYGRLCGAVLARAHCRAGDAAAISGYLGKSPVFDEAVTAFALAYADLTDTDHGMLVRARAQRAVPA